MSGNCDNFYFTFEFKVWMWVWILWIFKSDLTPNHNLSNKSNPNTDKPKDVDDNWLLNLVKYFSVAHILTVMHTLRHLSIVIYWIINVITLRLDWVNLSCWILSLYNPMFILFNKLLCYFLSSMNLINIFIWFQS